MDGVRIVSQEVNEMASQLQQFNGQLRTCLDGISAKMRRLDLGWDSPAGAALQHGLPNCCRYLTAMNRSSSGMFLFFDRAFRRIKMRRACCVSERKRCG
ncbi:MAG: hypothetical protein ACLVJ6_00650 [Merdibacter sp.]